MNAYFSQGARADLAELRRFYSSKNPYAWDRMQARIDTVVRLLEQFPLIGREGRMPGTREFVVTRKPLVIVYRLPDAIDLEIINILHGRQKYPPERS